MNLPVEKTLPQLKGALAKGSSVILKTPPVAGKTTLVPLALLNEDWIDGRIITANTNLSEQHIECQTSNGNV